MSDLEERVSLAIYKKHDEKCLDWGVDEDGFAFVALAEIRKDHEIMPVDIRYRIDLCGAKTNRDELWDAVRFLEGDGVPPGEIHFVHDGKIVGKITGIGS